MKTSSSNPVQIECNLNQLDRGLFAKLFLVCFKVEKSDGGVSLPELVGRIDGLCREMTRRSKRSVKN